MTSWKYINPDYIKRVLMRNENRHKGRNKYGLKEETSVYRSSENANPGQVH